jgi:hypothetical protein
MESRNRRAVLALGLAATSTVVITKSGAAQPYAATEGQRNAAEWWAECIVTRTPVSPVDHERRAGGRQCPGARANRECALAAVAVTARRVARAYPRSRLRAAAGARSDLSCQEPAIGLVLSSAACPSAGAPPCPPPGA